MNPDQPGVPRFLSSFGEDRLTIRASGGGAPLARLTSGNQRVVQFIAVVTLTALTVALVAGLWTRGPTFLFPVMLIFGFRAGRYRRDVRLADPVLADAALRAAAAEGREVRPGVWRIEGGRARELGTELQRLQEWRTPGTMPLATRQEHLVAQAGGPLAGYLAAARNAAAEPGYVIPEPFQPGQPWPTMPGGTPTQPWPTMPPPPTSG